MKGFLTYLNCILFSLSAFSQGALEGFIYDMDSVPVLFANVALYQNDTLVTGTTSDFDGYYFIDNLKEGIYDIRFSHMFNESEIEKNVFFIDNKILYIDYYLENEGHIIGPCGPWPLSYFNWRQKHITIEDSDILELKVKNLDKIITTVPNVTLDKYNELCFKGSRPGNEQYIIDGMRVYGKANLATSSINSMEIYHNGVPAKYGNTTSSVIVIESNSYFDYRN